MRSETKHGATLAPPLASFAIQRAAQECSTFAEASERLGVSNFGQLLAGSEPLREAWRRGRFLRRLSELAASPLCLRVVAEKLNLSEQQLEQLLSEDPEACDVFQQSRHRFFIEAKTAIMIQAKQGKTHCLRCLERLIKAEAGAAQQGHAPVNFGRLSVTQMQEATGVSRTQLARWAKSHNLSRNTDGTFSLPRFVAWLRKSPHGRTRSYRRKPSAIQKRILARIEQIVSEEMAGDTCREPSPENQGD